MQKQQPNDEMKLVKERRSNQSKDYDEEEVSLQINARIRVLEGELDRAREAERKMLESLMSQTKQLEKAKIELEEAKLDLQDTRRSIENPLGSTSSKFEQVKRSHSLIDHARAQQEILCLKNELRLATEAEEKSKRAMDDLAVALKEVAAEANHAKEKLAATEAVFLAAKAEANHSMEILKTSDERLHAALRENQRLRTEVEESAAAWEAKEEGFRECMRLFEEEIRVARLENDRLIATQQRAREEVSKLRDIMKHALNEATVVKEALEIARAENSQLKDALAEKAAALQQLKQELESLKVSEAAATHSVEELKSLLAAASAPILVTTVDDGRSPLVPPRKHRRYASTGSIETASCFDLDNVDGGTHVDEMESAWGSPMTVQKKKPMLRKFGDMLRRSFRN